MSRLTIDITGKCNLDCEYCYQEEKNSSLSMEAVHDIAADYPGYDIAIGGGEPFLYPGIVDLIGSLLDQGRKVHIATNGTMIPDKISRLSGRIKVQVSLPAMEKALYKEITAGNVDKVISNILEIKESFDTGVTTAVYRKNAEEIGRIIRFCHDNSLPLGVSLVFPKGKGRYAELMDREGIERLERKILFAGMEGKRVYSRMRRRGCCGAFAESYGGKKEYACPADTGMNVYVNPKGLVSGCEFI